MRETLKLALEALEEPLAPTKRLKAITAIKEALAQPEQEPVAFICEFYADEGHPFVSFEPVTHGTNTPLYTTPPPMAKPHKQEPVVWMYQDKSTHEVRFQKHMRSFVDHGQTYETPLYTSPPQRTWVGLTEDERTNIRAKVGEYTDFKRWDYTKRVQEATELALKEKNT